MALEVEDGTGKVDAESFVSVADADTYFERRGVAAWAELDDAAKEAALINAAEFLRDQYDGRWKGRRYAPDQALPWPRVEVYDAETQTTIAGPYFPPNIKRAQLEVASVFAIDNPYDPAGASTEGGQVVETTEKIGPLTETTKYSTSSTSSAGQYALPQVYRDRVTALLKSLLTSFFGTLRTERA